MSPSIRWLLHLLVFAAGSVLATDTPYFPARHEWQSRDPATLGLNAPALIEAVEFVKKQENPAPRDQALSQKLSFGAREPFDAIIGPMQERTGINGLIIYRGYQVATWGDTKRTDMSHSVTKSFLSAVVGLAWQQGLIKSVDDPVRDYLPASSALFESNHNRGITWDHLLRQTSDWQGELWGKPDWADRPEGSASDWANRMLRPPGSRYKYNDVRVNLLALSALQVWRKPLPQVLREQLMEPIGASTTWRWHGYDNSWVELDGQRLQSVSGGGHWGGGMFIHAEDMARFGYLYLRNGRWQDQQLIDPQWIGWSRAPGQHNPTYGYMNWFLNTERKLLPSTPASSVTFRGNGANIIYIDWDNDLLVVVRWIKSDEALDTFLAKVLSALPKR